MSDMDESTALVPWSSPNVSEGAVGGKGKASPGSGLTAQQRQLAESLLVTDKSLPQLAETFNVTDRTLRNWRKKPQFAAYLQSLVDRAVSESAARVKSRFAQAAPELADRAVRLARGTGRRGKPSHPYQDRMLGLVLDRVVPKPSGEATAPKLVLPEGDIFIVFKTKES